MKVYSVTVEYEDEREGQWVWTFAVLADTAKVARNCVLAHVESFAGALSEAKVTVHGEWTGTIKPRVIASLLPNPTGSFEWREIR